jgi:acyl carrier protein
MDGTVMTSVNEGEVLDDVARMVRDVIGEEWAQDVPITMTTSFSRDLELESIEFVALAEKLKTKYGKSVDFVAWLSGMELRQIIALEVGQLVGFISSCLSQPRTA